MRRVVRSCCGAMLVLAGTMAHAADDPWGQAFMAAAPAAVFDAAEAVSAPGEDVVVLYEESQHTFDDVGRSRSSVRIPPRYDDSLVPDD